MSPITKHVQIVSFNLTLSAKKEQWKCMVLPEMESIWMLLSPLRLWTRTFLKMGIPRGLKWKEPNSYDISRFEWRNTYCSPKFNSFGSKRIGEPNTVIAPSFSSFLEWRKSKSLILIEWSLLRRVKSIWYKKICVPMNYTSTRDSDFPGDTRINWNANYYHF